MPQRVLAAALAVILTQPFALMLLPRADLPRAAASLARTLRIALLNPGALREDTPVGSFRCLFWLASACLSPAEAQEVVLAFNAAGHLKVAAFLTSCLSVRLAHVRWR
jgi:hypothetical protein